MTDFVYRLTFPTAFVYRKTRFTIYKCVCSLQNIHKLFCGSSFKFQYPQSQLFCLTLLSPAFFVSPMFGVH